MGRSVPAAAPALEALNADAIDVTTGSSTASVAGLVPGVPFVVFAYQKMSPAAAGIVLRNGAAIHTLAGLAGHMVAANRDGRGEYLLMRGLCGTGSTRPRPGAST